MRVSVCACVCVYVCVCVCVCGINGEGVEGAQSQPSVHRALVSVDKKGEPKGNWHQFTSAVRLNYI